MTDMDLKMVPLLAKLREPFPPEQIGKLPKGNVQLDYVGHADVTARLLSVDAGWYWEPMATVDGLPALDQFGNLWIRLTVLGVTRIGVGDGKSMKECIGDAIRNAAMRFGVALDLWAKGDRTFGLAGHDAPAREQVASSQPPTTRRAALLGEIKRLAPSHEQQVEIYKDWLQTHREPISETTDIGGLELLRDDLKAKAAAAKKEHKALVEDTLAVERPAERLQGLDPEDPWAQDDLPTPSEAAKP